MRQRLGIAAAMLGDPPVIIMDEPFNGMDPEGIIWMRRLLRSMAAEGRAILVSSCLLYTSPVRDDIELVLRKGGDHPRREDGERRGQCPARDPGPADCDILVPHNRYSSPLLRDDIGERLGEGPLVARRVLGCIAFRRTESPWAPRRLSLIHI